MERIKKRPLNTPGSGKLFKPTPEYLESLISIAGIGRRFRGKTLENFNGPAAKVCATYCEDFDKNMAEGRGLYLYGPCGTGKTHLLSAIAQKLITERGLKARLYSTAELLLQLKATFDSKETESGFIEDLNESQLLILDDLGSERFSEWAMQIFYLIINRRYENLQPTLFSSNLSLEELAKNFNDRIASRIVGMCEIIKIVGKDVRLKGEKV